MSLCDIVSGSTLDFERQQLYLIQLQDQTGKGILIRGMSLQTGMHSLCGSLLQAAFESEDSQVQKNAPRQRPKQVTLNCNRCC